MALFLAHLCSCDSLLFNIQCPDMKHWKDMQGWDVHCCCSCLLFLLFFFSLLLLDSRLPSDEMLQVFEALRLPPLFDALSHSCHRGNFHGSTFQTFLNQDLPASHDPNASSMLSLRQFPGSQVHATFDLRRKKNKLSFKCINKCGCFLKGWHPNMDSAHCAGPGLMRDIRPL